MNVDECRAFGNFVLYWGNVRWYSQNGKQYDSSSKKKKKKELLCDPAILLLAMYIKELGVQGLPETFEHPCSWQNYS